MNIELIETVNQENEEVSTANTGEGKEDIIDGTVEAEVAAIVAGTDPEPQDKPSDEMETTLPPGVTEEPQHEEHMDLGRVKDYQRWVTTYLRVSDDEGDLLGDKTLEAEIKKICQDIKDGAFKKAENPEDLLRAIKNMTINYSQKINTVENSTIGIVTKYRIRLGMLFNLQKKLVKKLGRNWMDWFKENYDMSQFRSINDYMRLAKIPNIIRYAALGKERLLQIARQLKKGTSLDPVGDHIEKNGLDFDPSVEVDVAELKDQATIALSRQKLVQEGFSEIPLAKIADLVRAGVEVEGQHIQYLKAIRQANGDVLCHVDRLIATGGKFDPITTPERKAENFRKTIDRFLNLTTDALIDRAYLSKINLELCQQLKVKILELEAKFAPATNDTTIN